MIATNIPVHRYPQEVPPGEGFFLVMVKWKGRSIWTEGLFQHRDFYSTGVVAGLSVIAWINKNDLPEADDLV